MDRWQLYSQISANCPLRMCWRWRAGGHQAGRLEPLTLQKWQWRLSTTKCVAAWRETKYFPAFATQTNICAHFEPLTQIIFSAGAGDPRGGFLPGDRGPRISCDIEPQVGSLYSTRRCYVRWSSNLQCAIPELRAAPAPTKPRMNFVLWFEVQTHDKPHTHTHTTFTRGWCPRWKI